MRAEGVFPREPGAIADARRFVASELHGLDGTMIEEAILMVSELATNAITHAGSAFRIGIDRHQEIRIEVTDAGRGEPAVQAIEPTALDGRGLLIVQELARTWGVQHSDTTKTVWFTLG